MQNQVIWNDTTNIPIVNKYFITWELGFSITHSHLPDTIFTHLLRKRLSGDVQYLGCFGLVVGTGAEYLFYRGLLQFPDSLPYT